MQIKFNDTSILRFEFPLTWDAKKISDVTLNISTVDGYVLQSTDTVLFSATTISADVEANDLEIKLSSGIVKSGDWLRIQDGYDFFEDVEIKSFVGSTKTAALKRPIRNDHVSGSDAYGLFCLVTVDTTDTDKFPAGTQLIVSWEPDVGFPVTERAEIGKYQFQVPNFLERFSNLCPREYDALAADDRLEEMQDEAIKQLSTELRLRGIFINLVVDTDLLIPCLMAKMRLLVLNNGDASYDTEREVSKAEFLRQFELLCAADIWIDANQDGKIDAKTDHGTFFERGF